MKRTLLFYLLLVFNFISLNSQDFSKHKIGVSFGANLNLFSASFNKLPSVPNCCPGFNFGKGFGINSNFIYKYNVLNNVWVGGKFGIISLGGEFRVEEPTFVITPHGLEKGSFEHLLRAKLMNAYLQPLVELNLFKNLFLAIGIDFGYLLKHTFYQIETIAKPFGYGTFLDSLGNDTGKRTRNEYEGTVQNLNKLQSFITTEISYELPLNNSGTFFLRPEFFYKYPLTGLIQNIKWDVSSFAINLSLVYAPKEKILKKRIKEKKILRDTIKIITQNIKKDTIIHGKEIITLIETEYDDFILESYLIKITDTLFVAKKYILEGNIVAVGLDENGNEIPNPRFIIEEIVSNKLVPLLPYIFFEEGSSEIPSKYKLLNSNDEAKNFNISELFYEATIDIYHHLLNIIGQRMNNYPDANLTIVGCNSNLGLEKNNLELSEKRALAVKRYLVAIWGIAPNRINIEKRNLPEKPSLPNNEIDKIEENRRVELKSNHEKLLEWIYIEKVDRKAFPPIIRFKLYVESEAGLKEWKLIAYQNSSPNLKFETSGVKEPPNQIDWKLEDFQKIIPRNPEPIVFNLSILDNVGNRIEFTNKTLPIDVKTIIQKRKEKIEDYEIEKFSLILFDFDKYTIEGMNKRIVSFINSKVKPTSQVNIIGFTDRTGDNEYNRKLSEQRALSVKSALGLRNAIATGKGEEVLLYDNTLPEGRFYCRTVEIEMKTPIK